ncbi:MAG: DUF4388 domain-containing protein, partial [Deltaproteobacteria bacterium]|nr:DUF4388 domain-containing protein [Deltaproteobacteria bacterium]
MQRGTIEPFRLFKLFKGLYDQRASGWLHLTDGKAQRSVYLLQGAPAALVSAEPREQMLVRCVREGVCSTAEAAEVERAAAERDLDPLDALEAQGAVSAARAAQLRVDLIAEVVWGALGWQAGQFIWDPARPAPARLTPVDTLTTLALGGVEGLSEAQRAQVFASLGARAATLSARAPEEREALTALLGAEAVAALTAGASPAALARAAAARSPEEGLELAGALCGLLLCGALAVSAEAPPARP